MLDIPPRKLVLLPTSAGESRDLPAGPVEKFYSAAWFSDGKRIVLSGSEPEHRTRCYVQDLSGGIPTPRTPEGTYECIPSPDGKYVLAQGPKGKFSLYEIADGKPLSVPGLKSEDELIRFDEDGLHVYVFDESESGAHIYRLETSTGLKQLWKEIRLPDPVVESVDSVLLTPDGKWYACNYLRAVSDLYVVEGLK
jgi:hypothetical protein